MNTEKRKSLLAGCLGSVLVVWVLFAFQDLAAGGFQAVHLAALVFLVSFYSVVAMSD